MSAYHLPLNLIGAKPIFGQKFFLFYSYFSFYAIMFGFFFFFLRELIELFPRTMKKKRKKKGKYEIFRHISLASTLLLDLSERFMSMKGSVLS